MAGQRFRDSDPVEEILRIALKNQGGPDLALRQRLMASAAELGLSEQAVLEAEQQWLEQKKKETEFEEYRTNILRGLYMHLGIYAVVNMFLVFLNMLTSHGQLDWAPYVIVSWGIAIGVHFVASLVQLKHPSNEDLKNWREEQEGLRKPGGITVGLHVSAPQPVRDPMSDRNQTQA